LERFGAKLAKIHDYFAQLYVNFTCRDKRNLRKRQHPSFSRLVISAKRLDLGGAIRFWRRERELKPSNGYAKRQKNIRGKQTPVGIRGEKRNGKRTAD
jgi:hypothetical protein